VERRHEIAVASQTTWMRPGAARRILTSRR
jgi:hypothetical protein